MATEDSLTPFALAFPIELFFLKLLSLASLTDAVGGFSNRFYGTIALCFFPSLGESYFFNGNGVGFLPGLPPFFLLKIKKPTQGTKHNTAPTINTTTKTAPPTTTTTTVGTNKRTDSAAMINAARKK